jgi:hypothetical protein
MTVESFDPSAVDHTISDSRLARLLDAAGCLDEESFGLGTEEVAIRSRTGPSGRGRWEMRKSWP